MQCLLSILCWQKQAFADNLVSHGVTESEFVVVDDDEEEEEMT